MKLSPFLILAVLASTQLVQAESEPVMQTKGYELERYTKLMSKSPFDFDAPQEAPPPQIPAMVDWALAGLTKATEYSVAILVNVKTQERLRLTRYVNPPSSKANQTKSNGDTYTLEEITFKAGTATTVKNATAIVSKNGEQGEVKFDEKVLAMKGAPGKGGLPGMNQQMPNAQPIPGQPAGAGAANNAAMLQMIQQRNAGAAGQNNVPAPAMGGLPGQPIPGQVPNPVQLQPGLNLPQGGGNVSVAPAAGLNNAGVGGAAPGAGGTPQAANLPGRRRVVLPTNEPTPPPSIPNQ